MLYGICYRIGPTPSHLEGLFLLDWVQGINQFREKGIRVAKRENKFMLIVLFVSLERFLPESG